MTAIRRRLHDGASYELTSLLPGTAGLDLHDTDGDRAVVTFDRAGVRQLIEDLELIAGLRPTGPTVGTAAALAGAVRRNFELLGELEKTDPAAAELIAASIANHLRSWRPMALLASQVTP